MVGCKYGKIEIVNHLLRTGEDVNKIDDFKGTILMASVYSTHTEIVKLLLNSGAVLNAAMNNGDTASLIQ